jgi:hypothetical protein
MFNNPMGVEQRAGENIEAQHREELTIDIQKHAGYLPSVPAGSSSLAYLLEGIQVRIG